MDEIFSVEFLEGSGPFLLILNVFRLNKSTHPIYSKANFLISTVIKCWNLSVFSRAVKLTQAVILNVPRQASLTSGGFYFEC